jgi:hypothetical protein
MNPPHQYHTVGTRTYGSLFCVIFYRFVFPASIHHDASKGLSSQPLLDTVLLKVCLPSLYSSRSFYRFVFPSSIHHGASKRFVFPASTRHGASKVCLPSCYSSHHGPSKGFSSQPLLITVLLKVCLPSRVGKNPGFF